MKPKTFGYSPLTKCDPAEFVGKKINLLAESYLLLISTKKFEHQYLEENILCIHTKRHLVYKTCLPDILKHV